MFKSLVAAWVALVMAFVSFVPGFVVPEDKSGETDKSYPYIFVHGFLGWGEDEGINQDFSYWGATSCRAGCNTSALDKACDTVHNTCKNEYHQNCRKYVYTGYSCRFLV